MNYPVLALTLIALVAVPSEAFLCFKSVNTQKVGLFNLLEVGFCGFGSHCISYRIDASTSTYYVRGCAINNDENIDPCDYIRKYGGAECNTCNLPLCNSGEIPMRDESEGGDATPPGEE